MAAVLVLLFEGAGGELEVLLTTRSLAMRTHAGQTALPGGKADEDEETPALTAFREAHEEVGLPPSTLGSTVHILCSFPPFPSLHKLLVVPVVAFLTDNNLLAGLERSVSEVDALFYHQLEAVLDPGLANQPGIELAKKGSHNWPYDDDLYNTSDSDWLYGWQYRMHRFRTTHSPVKGLTADILLLTAQIAYDRPPTFERYAPRQKPFEEMITAIVKEYHEQAEHAPEPNGVNHLIPT
ncbi:hypothetical protein AURDEDRAFT_100608 [Auricularia subglabra TFB-10046 SS5]|nr:hypothetical protein AURDEDRAFT_100608 [Auricularia subglabra TFB-10046 SS5]